jgi:hypothetical protein
MPMSTALAPSAPAPLAGWSGATLGQRAGDLAAQAVYTTCYATAFAATLPIALIAFYTPKSNWFVRGFVAGSRSAFRLVRGEPLPATYAPPLRASGKT